MSADRDADRFVGLLGESGRQLMELRRGDVVVATYLQHVDGKLWSVVPRHDRLLPAVNDPMFGPNVSLDG